MEKKHRRNPSAKLSFGTNFKEQQLVSFTSTLNLDPPHFNHHAINTPHLQAPHHKNYPPSNSPKKFSHNYSLSSNNEFCSFLSSSAENFIKEMNHIQEKYKEETSNDEFDCITELKEVVNKIKEKKRIALIKIENERKEVKNKLWEIFCFNANSDIDTERRIESLRCSGDTVQGPGSFYRVDDLSLVKFEPSVEYNKKFRVKSVTFNI